MKKIYITNGLPRSGKTLFGKLVGEELNKRGINFLHTSSIDPVKQILMPRDTWGEVLINGPVRLGILEMLKAQTTSQDWDGVTKDEYWRGKMSELKARMTEYRPELIHTLVLAECVKVQLPYVIFVDIREPENIESFKSFSLSRLKDLEVYKVLLTSDRGEKFSNNSDSRVYEVDYDIIIENSRNLFIGDEVSQRFLQMRADMFVKQEVLEGRPRERVY